MIGLLAFVGSFSARLALSPWMGQSVPYIFFFPGIVVSAWYGGFYAGVFTTALSWGAALYLISPHADGNHSPLFAGSALFLCTGIFISWINDAFRRTEYRAKDELEARKESEQALQTSEERLRMALDAGGGMGTWDWNIRSNRVVCCAHVAKLFSLKTEQAAAGQPAAAFLSHIYSEDRAEGAKVVQRACATGLEEEIECRVLQSDGSVRWICVRGRCHRDEANLSTRVLGVAFDITERRAVEEKLRKAHRDLQEFSYVASHDLREPLRMVASYSELITRRIGKEDAELHEFADFVKHGVQRMDSLIADLLSFSRAVNSQAAEPLSGADLTASLEGALSVLQSHIDESGAVIRAQPLPFVHGDTKQMTHVFQNLLSNALKYSKKGGLPEIVITTRMEDNRHIVSVQDNGIGFEPQYAEHIFGLFKRLHRSEYPGTGLGLAICQRILERNGGQIWAESRLGEGATFAFSLPAAKEQSFAAVAANAAASS